MMVRALGWLLSLVVLVAAGCKFDEGYFNRRLEELDQIAAKAGPETRKQIEQKKAELRQAFGKLPAEGRSAALHELGVRAKAAVGEAEKLLAAEGEAAKRAEAAKLLEYRKLFVGTWKGQGMHLAISPGGSVHYERGQGGAMSRKVTAPITEFQRNHFKVGFMGITTTFRIDQPPREVDGVWKMKVDGVELTRVDEGAGKPKFGAALCTQLEGGQCADPKTAFGLETEKLHLVYVTPKVPAKGQKYNVAWIAEDVGKAAPANFKIADTDLVYDGVDQERATHFTVTAHLSRPKAGWPPGAYRVEVRFEGKVVSTVKFRVGAAAAEQPR